MPNIYFVPYIWKPDRSFQNIIRNGDFERWTKGVDQAPDGWEIVGSGGVVREEATVLFSKYSAKVTLSADGDAQLRQILPFDIRNRYEGRTCSFGCYVKTSVSDFARVAIEAGGVTHFSTYHPGDGEWHLLTVTAEISVDAYNLYFHHFLIGSSGNVAYFDGAIAVEGKFLPAFIPHTKDRSVGLGYENPEAFANNVIQRTDSVILLSLESQSSTDWTDLDMNLAGSGLIPPKANAVLLIMGFGDTGFPGGEAHGMLRKKGNTYGSQEVPLRPSARGNDQYATCCIGLDNNGYLQYRIGASGPNTAALRLKLMGWIEPA